MLHPFLKGYRESLEGNRKGDKPEETEKIKDLLLNGTLGIVTENNVKYKIMEKVSESFGIKRIRRIEIPTSPFDLTETPALSKAKAGRLISDCDFFLARGRLGLPGSGAMTVLTTKDGFIVSAVTSPPSHIHKMPLESALILDTTELFRRLGLTQKTKGITEKTETVFSGMTFIDLIKKITEKKWEPLKKFKGEKVLIIGGYLWGAFLGPLLKENFKNVYLFDLNKDVLLFCREVYPFKLPKEKQFDLIIDLTGYGGIEVKRNEVGNFRAKTVISENPSGEKELKTPKTPHYFLELKNGDFPTSGTMTLTVKVSRMASEVAERTLPILYAVPQLKFLENLLFNFSSASSFLKGLSSPVLAVSALRGKVTEKELDEVILSLIENLEFSLRKVK